MEGMSRALSDRLTRLEHVAHCARALLRTLDHYGFRPNGAFGSAVFRGRANLAAHLDDFDRHATDDVAEIPVKSPYPGDSEGIRAATSRRNVILAMIEDCKPEIRKAVSFALANSGQDPVLDAPIDVKLVDEKAERTRW